jgi:hypothetical protein
LLFFSKKQSKHSTDTERPLLRRGDASDDSFLVKTTFKGTNIAGHITFAAFDLLQIEIGSPYSGLRDGYYNDFAEIPEKYWYVKDNRMTKLCRKGRKEASC